MPSGPIQFGPTLESGDEQLAGASPNCVNVLVDGKGAVRRRPGIVASSDYVSSVIDANGIDGIYRAINGQTIVSAKFSTSGTKSIYRVSSGGSTLLGTLKGSERPTFAETEAIIVLAAGSTVRKYVFADAALTTLGGSPAKASHAISNASRVLLNRSVDYTAQVQYSDFSAGTSYTGHETWSSGASGYFSAEARADPVVALHENTNEVFCFGKTNLQVFAPDATYDYAPVATREYGCPAPYSIIRVDGGFAWFDHRKRFIISDGRSYQDISGTISSALDDIDTVSDCYGYRVQEGQYDCLVWTFPSANITYCFQIGKGWSVWSGYSGAAWTSFPVLSHHYREDGSGENLVGTTSGKIAMLSRSAYTDLGDPIQGYVETGFINRGTDAKKWCKCLRLALKRGVSQTSSELSMQIRYRDDRGDWSDPINIGMGPRGDTNPVVELRALGAYRRRQWAFNFQGNEDFVLVSATEEYDTLGV